MGGVFYSVHRRAGLRGLEILITMRVFAILADLVLVLHVAVVLFNGGGLLLIWLGYAAEWQWVRHRAFRVTHVLLMGMVAAQAVLGILCPLTTLESLLRSKAGESAVPGESFVAYWLHRLIFFELPPWFFTGLYAAVFVLTALAWYVVRPNGARRCRDHECG